MKKTMLPLIIIISFSFILSGCAVGENKLSVNNLNISVSTVPVASETAAPTPVVRKVKAYGDWQGYSTIKKLADKCQDIIIGKVEKKLPVVRILVTYPDSEVAIYRNYSPFHILIEKTIKGNKKEGDYIDIVQSGGTYTGITENNITESVTEEVEYVEYMEEGAEYLLFVRGEDNVGKDLPYYYYLPNPVQGYCKITDGKITLSKYNPLFANGMSIDEAIKQIEDSQKPEAAKK